MYKQTILILLIVLIATSSCGSAKKLSYSSVEVTENDFLYQVENLDKTGKINSSTLSVLYDGFSITYRIELDCKVTFTIENTSNKSLILDKSKCYVLYNGYASDLFKDVRSGRMTTYNNVQDAINNVQTGESSVTMSIPPYSKWDLDLAESNIVASPYPKSYSATNKIFTPFTADQTIEFIIPYTYDYSLAEWNTSRNRLFIGEVNIANQYPTMAPPLEAYSTTPSSYGFDVITVRGSQDGFHIVHYDGTDLINYNKVYVHNTDVETTKSIVGTFLGLWLGGIAAIAGTALLLALVL